MPSMARFFLTFEPAWQQWLFSIVFKNGVRNYKALYEKRRNSTTGNTRTNDVVFQFATSDPVKALQIIDKRIEDDIFDRK